MRSSSYLWGCDRALTALPGQLCHGLLCAAPEVKHGESPHAKAAASRENEKEGGGEGGGKGTARSGSDGGATQRQSRRGDRTVPCPPKHQPSTEGRASARRLPRRAGPGSPAASAACTPPPRPRLIAPAPGRGTYWSPGQSGSPPWGEPGGAGTRRLLPRSPPGPAWPGSARLVPARRAALSLPAPSPLRSNFAAAAATTDRGDTAEAPAPPCACAAAPPPGRHRVGGRVVPRSLLGYVVRWGLGVAMPDGSCSPRRGLVRAGRQLLRRGRRWGSALGPYVWRRWKSFFCSCALEDAVTVAFVVDLAERDRQKRNYPSGGVETLPPHVSARRRLVASGVTSKLFEAIGHYRSRGE